METDIYASRVRPKKHFGQHFLANAGAASAICNAALASEASAILEIGPGRGALTDILVKDGRPLWALELDSDVCQFLGERYKDTPNFHLLQGDAKSADLPQAESLCIVGNLPYNAATAILTRLLTERVPWERMALMFQLEVGQKLMGRPGEKSYGPLSVLVQVATSMETIAKLGPGSFSPKPKVDSITILFKPKADALSIEKRVALLDILHKSFAFRRKTLANNWGNFLPSEKIAAICDGAEISASSRAEAVAPEKWIEIANIWGNRELS
ncbi:MAG: 16S rRNA (adenine(1518)-N(6)/adenine(1519)-N(6))-dimethyltransferase RsmA [Holophagales bacterium]|nr:16S rRNA (adenine(1518)-N(6)/adenine(1519)-N(6))-dimethyltransferase RsmA [Holophagales bacterium]